MQRNHRRQVIPQRTDSFLEKFAPSTKKQIIQDENKFDCSTMMMISLKSNRLILGKFGLSILRNPSTIIGHRLFH